MTSARDVIRVAITIFTSHILQVTFLNKIINAVLFTSTKFKKKNCELEKIANLKEQIFLHTMPFEQIPK